MHNQGDVVLFPSVSVFRNHFLFYQQQHNIRVTDSYMSYMVRLVSLMVLSYIVRFLEGLPRLTSQLRLSQGPSPRTGSVRCGVRGGGCGRPRNGASQKESITLSKGETYELSSVLNGEI